MEYSATVLLYLLVYLYTVYSSDTVSYKSYQFQLQYLIHV